jgi:(5-formylfuran-3-yl)methyl phosphate synthase
LRAIVGALRRIHPQASISATVGDHATGAPEAILHRVRQTADTGVDWVKVGIDRASGTAAEAVHLLQALGDSGAAVVPVFLADRGLDRALWDAAARQGFAAWMLDTADKTAGSLLDQLPGAELEDFIRRATAAGALAGLAGSLRLAELPRLAALAPAVIGFRGAVCDGDRRGTLDPARLARLRDALRQQYADEAPH